MNRKSAFEVSISTVIGSSSMLGHTLEDRSSIRDSQNAELLSRIQAATTVPLTDVAHERCFCVSPLDILVTKENGRKQFHVIELNGTGIGGLTNLTEDAIAAVLDDLSEMAWHHTAEHPLILVAVSGKEDFDKPRLNRLVYEKMLYCEALRKGFLQSGFPAVITTNLDQVNQHPELLDTPQPTIVLGYIGELLDALKLGRDGKLFLKERQVTGAVNDRFCLNVVDRFGHRVNMAEFEPMNRCFLAGADKGVSYDLMNEYQNRVKNPTGPEVIDFEHAYDREQLIEIVLNWVRDGKRAVIKPRGTGVGHGIEFFLDADEEEGEIIRKIDDSIKTTTHYYRMPGGSFPYTVCQFMDTAIIDQPTSPMAGRKYELRVVVYRDGGNLKAFPSIVKVAPKVFDPNEQDRNALINNITNSGTTTKQPGLEHMLPLCNEETLEVLGMSEEELTQLSGLCTGYVEHVVKTTCAQPERFELAPKKVPMFGEVPVAVKAQL